MEQPAEFAVPAVNGHEHNPATTANNVPRSTSKTPAPIPLPIQREQREKKDSLKKREAASTSASAPAKRKAQAASTSHPSPVRYAQDNLKPFYFEAPKETILGEHDATPLPVPGQQQPLYRPLDFAENKRGFRYQRAIADPIFAHKQYLRATSPKPHCARLSFEDSDKWMHFSQDALYTSNEKGWRMSRANVCAREGTLYYEIKIHKGIPLTGPANEATGPAPHVRFGWARREAPLDAPVGFDGYSYGITDMRFETMHRSRPGKFYHSKKGPKTKGVKSVSGPPATVTLAPEDQHVKEGDVIGVEIQLPSLSLQQKIVSGVYNPAVDIGDGFDEDQDTTLTAVDDTPMDVIRDRAPLTVRNKVYFEILDYVSTKPMENYADRTTSLASLTSGGVSSLSKDAVKTSPNPNHEHVALRTLPHSAIRIYKNGNLVGTAFENLLAFLPPASQPSKVPGLREGNFDDGMLGYFPAIACFFGGVAEINFGDGERGFWAAPEHIRLQRRLAEAKDVEMRDAGLPNGHAVVCLEGWRPGRTARAIGERYKEQVAEDIVWDIVDEADFYVQDGGVIGGKDRNNDQ